MIIPSDQQKVTIPNQNISQKAAYVFFGTLFLLCIIMLIYILHSNTSTKHTPTYTLPTPQQTPPAKTYEEVLHTARQAYSKGTYVTAANSLITFASTDSNKQEQYSALLQAATLLANAGKYQQSLALFKQTEKIEGVTYTECQGAALVAQALGDKTDAIYYWQRCIAIMPTNYPGSAQDRQRYENEIKQLQE